jgi:hypothetical protein
MRTTRGQLERDGWRFTVPPEVAARLQAAGMTESLVEPG